MENTGLLLEELIGKNVLVKTAGGIGTKNGMMEGDYNGTLLAYDGKAIKLEYIIKKFIEGGNVESKAIILINADYIITIEEYQQKA